jgi:hypothetical protein
MEYSKCHLNFEPQPNATQQYNRTGDSEVQHLYHPAIDSEIRVTQSHDRVSPGGTVLKH